MNKQETYQRVYHVVKTLRESGMTYEEIETFFDKCIEAGKKNAKTH